MSRLAWIALVDAGNAPLGAAQQWRDETLLPQASSLPGAQKSDLYCAFNASQLALVTQLSAAVAERPSMALQAPAGMTLRQDLAELTYEIQQPGTDNQDDEAILYSVRFRVPGDWADEFDRWYEDEHLAMIYGCKHWSMTRRYRFVGTSAEGPTHLALHYLSDARGLDAPQLKASRLTPWRNRFLGQRWFTNADKMIYFRQTLGAQPA